MRLCQNCPFGARDVMGRIQNFNHKSSLKPEQINFHMLLWRPQLKILCLLLVAPPEAALAVHIQSEHGPTSMAHRKKRAPRVGSATTWAPSPSRFWGGYQKVKLIAHVIFATWQLGESPSNYGSNPETIWGCPILNYDPEESKFFFRRISERKKPH